MKPVVICCLLFGLLFSSLVSAETVAEARALLSRYQQSYENRQASIEDLEAEISYQEDRVRKARESLLESEQELATAQDDLRDAERLQQVQPGSDSERALRQAEFSVGLYERAVRSGQKRLERLEGNLEEYREELAEERVELGYARARIATQRERIERLRAEEARQVQQAAAAREAAQEQARREAAEQAAAQAQARREAEQAAAAQAAAAEQAASPEQTGPAQEAADAEAQAKVAANLDQEDVAYARKVMQRLERNLGDNPDPEPLFNRLFLTGTEIDSVEFEFLGEDQYRAEAVVQPGEQLFEVRNFRYKRTIPETDAGATYVFIVDYRRASRPRLSLFNKALLEHL